MGESNDSSGLCGTHGSADVGLPHYPLKPYGIPPRPLQAEPTGVKDSSITPANPYAYPVTWLIQPEAEIFIYFIF